MNKILEGIRVLDLTNVLSGPFATAQLALLGAEVIKIENPNNGDLARNLGCLPEYNKKLTGTSFLAQNANKKSFTLNLKSEKGKEIFIKLAHTADVLVENFRPGVMKRLSLDYDSLKEINPKLIYCAISGFGQTGPDAKKPAYDQIIQGLSGVMAVNGDKTLNPLRAGFPICDTVGGMNAAFAVIAALFHRQRTGEAQFIDIALIDSIMPFMGWVTANLMIGNQQPTLLGNDNFTSAPSGMFETKDGYINIAANKQEQWETLAEIIGTPELKEDPRFKIRDDRKKNRSELSIYVNAKLKEKDTSYWVDILNKNGVPSGAILKLNEALNQEQIKHRNTFTALEVDGIGEIPFFNLTAKFEKTPGIAEKAPPKLSEHTNQYLEDLGYTNDEINEFADNKII